MTPTYQAIEKVGGPARVAALCGVSTQAVCFWRDGKRDLPVKYVAIIEAATGGVIRRWDLRPEDWHRIWPELIGTEGAPAVPAVVAEVGDAA